MVDVFCYVGDVSGYKNILLSLPLEQQLNRIREFHDLIDEAVRIHGFQNSFLNISDTIFVIAENNEEELKKLLDFAKYMLENGMKKALPLRAAIDFGEAIIDKEKM